MTTSENTSTVRRNTLAAYLIAIVAVASLAVQAGVGAVKSIKDENWAAMGLATASAVTLGWLASYLVSAFRAARTA